MRRRTFLGLAGAAAVFPRVAMGQQAKVPRIAFQWAWSELPEAKQSFLQGLADYGYVDGKNVTLEFFEPQSQTDYAKVAAAVVATRPDLIVAHGTVDAAAAEAATTTIPIVFGGVSDPVGSGIVASLARPGRNATGTSLLAPDLVGKQISILKEIIPNVARVVGLNDPGTVTTAVMDDLRAAAEKAGIEAIIVDFTTSGDFETQFDRAIATSPQVVFIPAYTYYSTNSDRFSDLQISRRVALVSSNPANFTRALLAYGPNNRVQERKTGAFIDAILKGAKPGDLPVDQPTVFDFAINSGTAKALGITIPPSILAQATIVNQ